MWEQLQKRMEQDGMSGIPTGISKLDQMTHGWQPNNLIVVAARHRGKLHLDARWLECNKGRQEGFILLPRNES